MRTRKNLLAGISSSVWSALVGLAVIPLYLKYLGLESYGLIGFFSTLQVLLVLLDLGIAPTINREVARYSASGDISDVGNLLHSLAMIYWGMAVLIALAFFILAPFIAEYWLQSNTLPYATVVNALMLMGGVVACRWPSGLYQNAIIGAQRLTISSVINVVYVTLGSFGAVAILVFVSPTIEAFFMWQVGVGFAYVMTTRWASWWIIGGRKNVDFNIEELKRVWRFSAGMSLVAVTSIVLMQLDKVLLSKIISLEDFGRYTLAGVVASGMYILLTPVFNTLYPKISILVASDDTEKLLEVYRFGTRLLSAIIFPIAVAGAAFSEDFVYLWTGNSELAQSISPVIALLLFGTALNGAMHFPYALQLAYGAARLPVKINLLLISVHIPITVALALLYGVIGGAAAWAILNGIYLFLGTWMTHRSLLKGIAIKWLFHDVLFSFGISLIVIGLGWYLVIDWDYPHYIKLIFGAVLACLACILAMVFPSNIIQRIRRSW